ncbi:DUF4276 family protein [Methylomagnum sp.]
MAGKLLPDAKYVSSTLDNKANLLREAGNVAAALLNDGCDRVLIVWDLRPAWPDKNNKPCRYKERAALLQAIEKAGIGGNQPVYLICIEQELESWLLADECKIAEYLSTPAHPCKIKKVRHPDREKNPKAALIKHFDARGQRYIDHVHAVRVVSSGEPDWGKLRRSESFTRFEAKLTGN